MSCLGRIPKAEAANCAWVSVSSGLSGGFGQLSDGDDLQNGSQCRESFEAVGLQEAAGNRWIQLADWSSLSFCLINF